MFPTNAQIDAILPHADRFAAADFSVGELRYPPGQVPYWAYSECVHEFEKALYHNGWIARFDWPAWQDTAWPYVEFPEKVASADVLTIQKLLTTHVRKDRFCEGHLAAMFQNGHIGALLARLRELRARR